MPQHDDPAQTRSRPLGDVLQELASVLKALALVLERQTAPAPKRAAFLDRPIVLTLIGSVFITALTLAWQSRDQRNAAALEYQRRLHGDKHALLRTFSAAIHKSGNVMNRWLTYTLFIGEEKSKPAKERDAKNLAGWSKLSVAAQNEHLAMEPIEGILIQIGAAFRSTAVRDQAKALAAKVGELEGLLHEANAAYNKSQTLSAKEAAKFHVRRREILDALAKLRVVLIEEMGKELAAPP